MKSGLHSSAFYLRLWQELTDGGVIPQSEKSGELYHEDKHIRPFIDGSGNITHFVGKGRDIGASIQTKKRLGYLPSHDVRTGVSNRILRNPIGPLEGQKPCWHPSIPQDRFHTSARTVFSAFWLSF